MKSIQEIRDSLTKISKWPWKSACLEYVITSKDEMTLGWDDNQFIAQSPQLISDLCDRLEVAKKALQFYADIEMITLDGKPFLVDKGKIAREALEKIK